MAVRVPLEDGLSGSILAEQAEVVERPTRPIARDVPEPAPDSTGSGTLAVERPSNTGLFAGIAAFTLIAGGIVLLGVIAVSAWVLLSPTQAPTESPSAELAAEPSPERSQQQAARATAASAGAEDPSADPLDELLSAPEPARATGAAAGGPTTEAPTEADRVAESETTPGGSSKAAPAVATSGSGEAKSAPAASARGAAPALEDEETVDSLDKPVAEAPASTSSRVSVTGEVDAVRLDGAGGSYDLPGMVAPGSYLIRATFSGETVSAGSVTVEADHPLTLSCRAGLKRCTAR